MTIKEVEQVLDIPRATVRFYEKEGLIAPSRESNGYRDYSEEDIDKLKKIIILRKLGIAVSDIEDIFDGAKGMKEVLGENISNLQKQMEELEGALIVSRRMMDDGVVIDSFDSSKYWNVIEEEEKHGHKFMTIAKDIVQIERGVFFSYFSWTDCNGNIYDSLPVFLRNMVLVLGLIGCSMCLINGEWSLEIFFEGVLAIFPIIIADMILRVPIYFLGKKYPWVKEHRESVIVISCVLIAVILIIFLNIL